MPYADPAEQRCYNTQMKARVRAEALPRLAALMGPRCQRCGYSDIRALRLIPLPGALPPSKTSRAPQDYHRRVLRDVEQTPEHLECYDLLCANCDLTTS